MAVSLRSYPCKLISTIQALANSHKQVTFNSNLPELSIIGASSKSSFLTQVSRYNVDPGSSSLFHWVYHRSLNNYTVVKLILLVWPVSIRFKITAIFFQVWFYWWNRPTQYLRPVWKMQKRYLIAYIFSGQKNMNETCWS